MAGLFLAAAPGALGAEIPPHGVQDHPWMLVAVVLGVAVFTTLAVILWNLRLQSKMARAMEDLEQKNQELEQSREDLLSKENRFRQIFQNAPYAMVITDLKTGRFLDANKAYLENARLDQDNVPGNDRRFLLVFQSIPGEEGPDAPPLHQARSMALEKIQGMDPKDLVRISEENRQASIKALERNRVLSNVAATILLPDGSLSHLIYSSVLLDVEGPPQALTMTVDITGFVEARLALAQSEERFRTMFHHAPVGIFRSSFEGRLVEANATFSRMLGYGRPESMMAQIRNLAQDIYSTPLERQRVLDAVVRSPEGVRLETRFKRRDGQVLHVIINAALSLDANGQPAWLDGAIEDISSLKQAEMETRRLAAAVEQGSDIIFITDPAGVIQYVNPAFERVTGYSRQEALGNKPSMLKSGKHGPDFYQELWQTITRGEAWSGNFINKRRDGSLFTEQASITPMLDQDGRIIHFVASKKDITQELALKEQNRQMQKMEAIGRLTGGVAHDFNNLLQAMNGFVELANMDLPPDHRSRAFLDQTLAAGRRAANLTSQLLVFSRRQTLNPRVLNLNTAVDDLLKMMGRVIGKHIRITWDPADSPLTIYADPGMMDQVLMNLCINARDAMPEHGTLHIAARQVSLDADYCKNHPWARPGQYALLAVRDTGAGMDPDTLERIFEPFFTTKPEGKGTGLGLATVYGIVKQHRGMISVNSQPGQGAEFTIHLPLHRPDSPHQDPGREEAAPGGRETILLAEDDTMVREMAAAFLKRGGYTVLTARDGQEAVDLCACHHGRIALVILDVVMPRMGGYAAYAHIREIAPDLPVLFSSAYSEEGEHGEFMAREKMSFLQKPYSSNLLLKTVRHVLDHGPFQGIYPHQPS